MTVKMPMVIAAVLAGVGTACGADAEAAELMKRVAMEAVAQSAK